MIALVTGGAGFIGSHLVKGLARRGDKVIVLDDLSSGHESNLKGLNCEFTKHDVSEPLPKLGKIDAIFHLAAITDPRHGNDEETMHKNIVGFDRILDLQGLNQCPVVYASTAGVYGNGVIPMQEDQPKEIVTAYGESKWQMDLKAAALKKDPAYRLPLVGLRYFNVFGPRESGKGRPASMIYHLSKQMVQGGRPRLFKWGEQVRDHIYVSDCVSATLLALKAPSDVYNVGTGIGTSFLNLVGILNKVWELNLEPEYFDMPYDPKTYQSHTLAETTRAREFLEFNAAFSVEAGVRAYRPFMEAEFS